MSSHRASPIVPLVAFLILLSAIFFAMFFKATPRQEVSLVRDSDSSASSETHTESDSETAKLMELPEPESETAAVPSEEAGKSDPKVTPPSKPVRKPRVESRGIRSGSADRKWVALTFDDGPHPEFTPKILAELRKRNLKATFFVLGNKVKRYPWILQQAAKDGHELGNHSYSHRKLYQMSSDQILYEIRETQRQIRKATGLDPVLFRPPYGKLRSGTHDLVARQSLELVLWSVDTRDWLSRNPGKIVNLTMSKAKHGSIILMHDIHATTAQALPQVLDELQARGFEFATISEICGLGKESQASRPNRPDQQKVPDKPSEEIAITPDSNQGQKVLLENES
jgi:peptidoglycan/xylan/chitin deacetylase (PgdA/CDA1 family)